MSEMAEAFRDQREFRRYARQHWHECPSAGCQFGGNPVKVPPGGNCRHCGWVAPGNRGDDTKAARRLQAAQWEREAANAAERKARRAKRTCDLCGKVLADPKARDDHRRMKHAKHPKVQAEAAELALIAEVGF